MIKLIQTAAALQKHLEQEGWPFCFIGGIAVQRWGQPRVTQDVDGTIFTGFGGELPVIERLLEIYEPRRDDAAKFAQVYRVLLLHDPLKNIGIDLSMGGFDYERRAIERSSKALFRPRTSLRTLSAEDLIVFKAFADRGRDWDDIDGILIRQKGQLDLSIVDDELPPLVELKEEPAILERWDALKRRYR